MAEDNVSLKLLGRQVEALTLKVGDMDDKITALTGMMVRLEVGLAAVQTSVNSLSAEMRAMASRHDRVLNRLENHERRLQQVEDRLEIDEFPPV